MKPNRPDISKVAPEIRQYIEALETELELLRERGDLRLEPSKRIVQVESSEDVLNIRLPAEPPTTISLVTATASGIAKRTLRHLYARQRRGGTGFPDFEAAADDPPTILSFIDKDQNLLLLSITGKAYRLSSTVISDTGIRSGGSSVLNRSSIPSDERIAAILPERGQGYLSLVSQSGMVRLLRHHVFGEYMKPGMALYDFRSFGPLAAACWTDGSGDLFIATQKGRAIRFSERLVPPAGTLGIRLANDDIVVGVTPVYDDSGVFLLGADGKGTIRMMENFTPNKAPGAGGKIAMNTDRLVCALSVDEKAEVFIITRQGKMIRFPLEDIPPKDAPVMGVNCLSLRADEPSAVILA